jgi:hypothetical protein
MQTPNSPAIRALHPVWNKGRIVGQKRPLKPKHVWAIREQLELAENHRDLALFNMAINSKLRGCDLVRIKGRRCYGVRPDPRAGVRTLRETDEREWHLQ